MSEDGPPWTQEQFERAFRKVMLEKRELEVVPQEDRPRCTKPWERDYCRPLALNEYQEAAQKTANYHGCLDMEDSHIKSYNQAESLIYCSLGLAGESGEVVELTKKFLRDDHMILTPERKESYKAELGDVLWYIANLAKALDFTLEDIAEYNIQKLNIRHGICSDPGLKNK